MTEEKIDFENAKNTEETALGPGDLTSNNFIKNPPVGESIVIDVKKVYKDTNITAKDPKTGQTFSTALSGTEPKGFKYTIETKEGKKYSPTSWEAWNGIKAIILPKMSDTTTFDAKTNEFVMPMLVKVKHIKDGFKEKEGNSYEVTEGTVEDLQEMLNTDSTTPIAE